MRQNSATKNHKALSDEMTRQATVSCLKEHLVLDIQGTKATTEMALDLLIHAASVGQSIEASCAELETADSNTIREYLNAAFSTETLADLETHVNAALESGSAQIAISNNTVIEYLSTQLLRQQGYEPQANTYIEISAIPVRAEQLAQETVAAAMIPEPLVRWPAAFRVERWCWMIASSTLYPWH